MTLASEYVTVLVEAPLSASYTFCSVCRLYDSRMVANAIWSMAGFELSTISRVRTILPEMAVGVTVSVANASAPSVGFVPSTWSAVAFVEDPNLGTTNGVALLMVPREHSPTSGRPLISSGTYRSGRYPGGMISDAVEVDC